jgi:hypothetical protein
MVYRALIGFLLMGSVEILAKFLSLSNWTQFSVRLGILAVLFWQFSIGRVWAKWLIASLIAIGFGVAFTHRNPESPSRFLVVAAICIVSLIVVLWPAREAKVQNFGDR